MIDATRWIAGLTASLVLIAPVHASLPGAVAKEVVEAALEGTAHHAGAKTGAATTKRSVADSLAPLSTPHGGVALRMVEASGDELLTEMPGHSDDMLRLAGELSPAGQRALALHGKELIPLARRVGVRAIELEARAPGQAARVFDLFGDDLGKVVATTVRTEDLPRLIKYGELSDSAQTRGLLVDAYRNEGSGLFARIPPLLVLAGGLSSAMALGVYEATAPSRAKAKVLEENPEIVRDTMNRSTTLWAVVGSLMALLLLWRFGLMPWHRHKDARGVT